MTLNHSLPPADVYSSKIVSSSMRTYISVITYIAHMYSRKHLNAQNCLQSTILCTGFLFCTKKAVMPRRKLLLHESLKIRPSLSLKSITNKEKSQFFYSTFLVLPWCIAVGSKHSQQYISYIVVRYDTDTVYNTKICVLIVSSMRAHIAVSSSISTFIYRLVHI